MEVSPEKIIKFVESDDRYKSEIKAYYDSMNKLPAYDYSKFYSSYPTYATTITQGDGISGLSFINLPSTNVSSGKGMIFSSTCDIELENKRKFPSKIIYAPIMRLADYKNLLKTAKKADGKTRKYSDAEIDGHIDSIRKQKVGQIFYLPRGKNLEEEGLVFFDNICSCDNSTVSRDKLPETRIFSLSAYGWHVFLERLAYFFTRLSDETVELRFKPANA